MNKNQFDIIIKPKTGLFDIDLKEIWQYKDLIILFVKKSFAIRYKQTILGPLWFIINPLLTTIIFTIVFGKIAKIPTNGVPEFLFYMAGNTVWSFFSACVSQNSNTFVSNAYLFGKVYFPRLTVPISNIIGEMLNLGMNIALFLCFFAYFIIKGSQIHANWWLLYVPVMIFQISILALGFGIIVSSLTTKYRDLTVLVGFGLQLWMYATPIVYPLSEVPEKIKPFIIYNPMTSAVETFKYAFFSTGSISTSGIAYSWLLTVVIMAIGIVLFNKIEKTFMDTV